MSSSPPWCGRAAVGATGDGWCSVPRYAGACGAQATDQVRCTCRTWRSGASSGRGRAARSVGLSGGSGRPGARGKIAGADCTGVADTAPPKWTVGAQHTSPAGHSCCCADARAWCPAGMPAGVACPDETLVMAVVGLVWLPALLCAPYPRHMTSAASSKARAGPRAAGGVVHHAPRLFRCASGARLFIRRDAKRFLWVMGRSGSEQR